MKEREMIWSTIQEKIQAFVHARDWDQFHDPKNLAIGISVESGELLQCFRFLEGNELELAMQNPEFRKKVIDEWADTLFFVARFAEKFGIDPVEAIENKLVLNAIKYPVEESRGKAHKR